MDLSAFFSPMWLLIMGAVILTIGGLVWAIMDSFLTAVVVSACAILLLKIGGLPVLIAGIVASMIVEGLFHMIKKMRLKKSLRHEYGNRPKSEAEMKDMLEKFWDGELQHLTTDYNGKSVLVSKDHISKYLDKNIRRIVDTINYICGKSFQKIFCDETMPAVAHLDTLVGTPIYPKMGLLDCWLALLAPKSISFRGQQYGALHEVFAHQAERQFRRREESL